MKKQLLLVLIVLISVHSFAQISFEKGYYIDNSGSKVNGYIKNIDWKNNPTEFQYKASENAEKQDITIENVQAFEIYNAAKYERYTVKIDVSSQNLNDLGSSDQPKWETRQLFLKVHIEGKASLYSYINGNIRRYFFKKDKEDIEQLVYKKYMATETRIGENTQYRRQLWDALTCGNISEKIKNVKYTKSSLSKVFKLYNACEGNTAVDYEARVKRDKFNIAIKPGINFSSVVIGSSGLPNYNFDFDDKVGFQLGVEAEFVLGFNRNKWAIVAEPTFVSYSGEEDFVYLQLPTESRTTKVVLEYAAIEVPLGFRHYSFLSDKSKLFFNAFYMFTVTLNDKLYAERREFLDAKITPRGNFAAGIGYKYDDKYSVEFRYKTPRQLFPANSIWGTYDYNSFAIIFGYTIF